MNNDILMLLQAKGPGFSKGQRAIAKYITEAYDKAAFMTASKLGKTVGVSESTVVRFAVELGYEGYPEMQKAMQEMVLNRLTNVQRIEVANDRFGNQDVVSMVLHADMEKLRQTGDRLNRKAFQDSVNAVLKAKRIFILGVRSVAPLASFLGHYLGYMFYDVNVITASASSEMFEKLVNITSDDVVIAFSFPRYSTATVNGAKYCRSVGATVIGMTDTKLSPLAKHCDHLLLCKSDMVSLVDSLVAPMSVINAMIVALASKRERELAKTFNALERVWEEYNVYEKQDDHV